jgi:hypothetical protein
MKRAIGVVTACLLVAGVLAAPASADVTTARVLIIGDR